MEAGKILGGLIFCISFQFATLNAQSLLEEFTSCKKDYIITKPLDKKELWELPEHVEMQNGVLVFQKQGQESPVAKLKNIPFNKAYDFMLSAEFKIPHDAMEYYDDEAYYYFFINQNTPGKPNYCFAIKYNKYSRKDNYYLQVMKYGEHMKNTFAAFNHIETPHRTHQFSVVKVGTRMYFFYGTSLVNVEDDIEITSLDAGFQIHGQNNLGMEVKSLDIRTLNIANTWKNELSNPSIPEGIFVTKKPYNENFKYCSLEKAGSDYYFNTGATDFFSFTPVKVISYDPIYNVNDFERSKYASKSDRTFKLIDSKRLLFYREGKSFEYNIKQTTNRKSPIFKFEGYWVLKDIIRADKSNYSKYLNINISKDKTGKDHLSVQESDDLNFDNKKVLKTDANTQGDDFTYISNGKKECTLKSSNALEIFGYNLKLIYVKMDEVAVTKIMKEKEVAFNKEIEEAQKDNSFNPTGYYVATISDRLTQMSRKGQSLVWDAEDGLQLSLNPLGTSDTFFGKNTKQVNLGKETTEYTIHFSKDKSFACARKTYKANRERFAKRDTLHYYFVENKNGVKDYLVYKNGYPYVKAIGSDCLIRLRNFKKDEQLSAYYAASWTGTCNENGLANGEGKLTVYKNGSEWYNYEGRMSNGMFNGHGRFFNGGLPIRGNWKNGQYDELYSTKSKNSSPTNQSSTAFTILEGEGSCYVSKDEGSGRSGDDIMIFINSSDLFSNYIKSGDHYEVIYEYKNSKFTSSDPFNDSSWDTGASLQAPCTATILYTQNSSQRKVVKVRFTQSGTYSIDLYDE